MRLPFFSVAVLIVLFGESFSSIYRRSAATIEHFKVVSFAAPSSPCSWTPSASARAPRARLSRPASMRLLTAKGRGLLDALHKGATLLQAVCKHGLMHAVQALFRKVLPQMDAAAA